MMFWRVKAGRYARYLINSITTAATTATTAPIIGQTGRMLSTGRVCSSSFRCILQPSSSQTQAWLAVPAHCRSSVPCSRAVQARPLSLHHSSMTNPHITSARSKASGRPLLPLQAAGGGGAGGSSGSNKGFSSGDSSSGGDSSGGLWEAYTKLLEQYPLLVKAITTALLSAVGNLICQLMVEGKSELDWRRFNTFTALGFVWVAPCLHFWFGALNRIVTIPGNTGALLRMALDQLGFAPLFISSMIAILAGLDGKSLDQCAAVVRRDLPDAIRANWALWVPAQFINFRFVPANYQVLFANMVALLWNVYFSFATRPKTA